MNLFVFQILPTRELEWGVGDSPILSIHYLVFVIAGIVFLLGAYMRYRFVKTGRDDEPRFNNLRSKIIAVIRDGFLFVRLWLRESKMGFMHLLIFWGVIVLIIGTGILTYADHFDSSFFRGAFYLIHEAFMDMAGLALLAGLFIAVINRYFLKPSRFTRKWEFAKDDGFVVWGLVLITILGFSIEGFRLTSGMDPYTAIIGGAISSILSWNVSAYRAVWTLHSLLAMILVASAPFTKLAHVIAAPINILTRSDRVPGKVRGISDEEYMGAIKPSDLQWRDLLSSLSCMRCGRCQDICPAANSGASLNPMFLMQNLRKVGQETYRLTSQKEEPLLLDTVMDMEGVWACTTCRACMEMCPVYIEQMEILEEMRRGIVESGEAPPDIRDLLTNIQKQKNPWGEAKFKRDQWTKGADIEIPRAKNAEFEWLWYVGCAHSFDNRNKPVTQKLARILADIGVNYAILGKEEGCCGNDVRRVGEEGLFQILKEENINTFNKYSVEKMIITSPHCYNTFINEYEGLEVRFILEVINEAIKSGKLKFKKPVNKRVTFHDPCYLGRYNKMYDLPREILKAIPGLELVEMPRNREKSFCCGAGGGNLVREYPGEDRPNNIRAREAASVAEVLAVACPFCMIMLEDGVKSEKLDDRLQVLDIVELVWESAYGE